jgi:hypothetical protein
MKIRLLIFLLFTSTTLLSQNKIQGIVVRAIIIGKDTVPIFDLPQVTIFSPPTFKSAREAKRFDRLARNVKKVYPYAKAAGLKFNEYNTILANVKDEKTKKRLMKKAEDELKAQYEEELKKLTFSQGKILVKLLDRETTFTSYQLIQDFRGNVMAIFWQGLGRVFGYNLKTKYDAQGEDKDIELIIQMIEAGAL